MTAVVQTKNLLAKLLATENITVRHVTGVKTASFHLKNRVLTLPVWHNISNDLTDLLIVHEVGHALDTPTGEYAQAAKDIAKNVFQKEVSDSVVKRVLGFLNVIEDARIDKRQKRRYPGSRKNYLAGYKELIERDFFGTKGKDINSLNFIDRLNIYFKGGAIHYAIDFTPEEKVLLRKAENQETFADAVALTEEVFRFCKDQLQEQTTSIQIQINEEGESSETGEDEDDGDSDWRDSYGYSDEEGDDEDSDADSSEGDDEDEDDSLEGKTKAEQGEDEDDEEGEDYSSSSSNGAGSDDDDIPQSHTDAAWQEKSQELVQNTDYDYVYINLPKINLASAIDDFKDIYKEVDQAFQSNKYLSDEWAEAAREFVQWRNEEKQSISFMVKEFEQRKAAELYSRQQVAKTGVIDTNKLHSYKHNDDIFRRITTIPKGKNHGFVMFLDWSGSMNHNLHNTIRQLLSLVLFCKQIQVPFEVYAFKDCGAVSDPWLYDGLENVFNMGSFKLRNFLSSRMTASEFTKACTYMWTLGKRVYSGIDGLSGTPLNEALIAAPYVVEQFQKKTKVEIANVIVLTDGDSNPVTGMLNRTTARSWRTRYFYNDPVTHKTYDVADIGQYSASRKITTFLTEVLKDRTGANCIGFFLSSDGYTANAEKFGFRWGNQEYFEKQKKFFADNRFVPVTTVGYDEYYVIDANSLGTVKSALQFDKKANNKSLAKSFSKFAAAKTINRVLLRNFVDRISGRHQKIA